MPLEQRIDRMKSISLGNFEGEQIAKARFTRVPIRLFFRLLGPNESHRSHWLENEGLRYCVNRTSSPVALQLRAPPKVSARAPAHRSYHFRGVKLKSCIKKIHHNLYISKQANVRIKHADTEGASHKKFGTDARVQ